MAYAHNLVDLQTKFQTVSGMYTQKAYGIYFNWTIAPDVRLS